MKKRQLNFELLRILCMYMIVVGHCLFHGRVTAKLGYGTVNYFLSYLIQSFSVVHVNCFVMLAGYFSIDREFQAQRLFRFWRQVVFYSVLIGLICSVCIGVTGTDVIKAIFPVSSNHYWFASVYMGNIASDAVCRDAGSAAYEETVPVSSCAPCPVFQREPYDFPGQHIRNLCGT